MSLATYSLRELLRRPARSLLTVIGIAVGVATVVASATAMHAARIGCTDLFDDISGPRSLEVTAASRTGFDGRIAVELGKSLESESRCRVSSPPPHCSGAPGPCRPSSSVWTWTG